MQNAAGDASMGFPAQWNAAVSAYSHIEKNPLRSGSNKSFFLGGVSAKIPGPGMDLSLASCSGADRYGVRLIAEAYDIASSSKHRWMMECGEKA